VASTDGDALVAQLRLHADDLTDVELADLLYLAADRLADLQAAVDDDIVASTYWSTVARVRDLRAAGDALAAATRKLVDAYMTEQSALYGHIAIDPDVLRALAEWGKARG
jgi:hypothetical protein